MQKLIQYYLSLRYLKPVQIWARLRLLAQRQVLHPTRIYRSYYLRRASGQEQFSPLRLPETAFYPNNAACSLDFGEIDHNTFTFLNRRVCLGQPLNWLPPGETQLWKYNLHYFDVGLQLAQAYAHQGNTQAFQTFRRLVREWLQSCPVATPIAWDSYPISLRVSNWLKAYTLFEPALKTDITFAAELRRSLYLQAHFLENHLEYHLLGNHLIENGRALLLAGLFFGGAYADRWQNKGKYILWHELQEQFLADGGHFERSPMYHQIMLKLYQEVVALLQLYGQDVPPHVSDRIQAMQAWLRAVLHPDGEIALMNDAALGIAGHPLADLAQTVPPSDGLRPLADSGYFVFRGSVPPRNGYARQNSAKTLLDNDPTLARNGRQNFLLFDCGPLGPDYFPGHGHCDALSYELSLAGQRFIVDSGVGNYYGDLDWRMYYRSTRAHNTVTVNDAEQSEIWGRFRVARRAQPVDVHWAEEGSRLAYVCGSHSGYRRLRGKISHRRWICWIDRHFWLICDQITGQGQHKVDSFIHFDPAVEIVRTPSGPPHSLDGEVKRGATHLRIVPWGIQKVSTYCGECEPIQGWVAPEFGLQVKNVVWGLHQNHELPLWLGYLLWPEQADVAVQVSPLDEQSCHLEVKSVETHYHIVCHSKGTTVEKKS
jgi:hypothetical protein